MFSTIPPRTIIIVHSGMVLTLVNIFLFVPPWRWSHKWPKYVGRYLTIKL